MWTGKKGGGIFLLSALSACFVCFLNVESFRKENQRDNEHTVSSLSKRSNKAPLQSAKVKVELHYSSY